MIEQLINVERMEHTLALFGSFDTNVRMIEEAYGVSILLRGTDIKVTGDPEKVGPAARVIETLLALLNSGEALTEQNIHYVMSLVDEGQEDRVTQLADDVICITAKGRPLKSKTLGQKKYIESIRENTITFGVGPAGTGKTYLAVAMAVRAFRAHDINRIILTRPAVEAGEKLGFLPGDLQNKVDPYLR
ncbi:MAG: phosphate starvation-inducible protein PhoH, partial [Oscillospiraceae bacterium]